MKAITKKLLEFQKEISAIKKDGKNPHFQSNYATLPQILSEVKPVLSKHGLVVLQPIKDDKVCTVIIDSESGESCDGSIHIPSGLNPQQTGSAITYYRRYLLAGMLSLEIEDDDGNAASSGQGKASLPDSGSVFDQAVKFLKDGGSITEIEKKYTLSAKTREKLLSAAI